VQQRQTVKDIVADIYDTCSLTTNVPINCLRSNELFMSQTVSNRTNCPMTNCFKPLTAHELSDEATVTNCLLSNELFLSQTFSCRTNCLMNNCLKPPRPTNFHELFHVTNCRIKYLMSHATNGPRTISCLIYIYMCIHINICICAYKYMYIYV